MWERIYFSLYLVFVNLKLIFLPYGLHSFIVDYPEAYWSAEGVAGVIFCFIFGIFLWKQRGRSVVFFSLASFLVALWPVLNIIPFRSVTLVSMRWLYLPMAMLSVGFAVFIGRFLKVHAAATWIGVGLIGAYLGGYTYILNKNLWHDERVFFQVELEHFHNDFYAGGFAENLLDRKAYRRAEKYFQLAILRYPREALNYLNYSALLIDVGRPQEAMTRLEEARNLAMTSEEKGQWYTNMGLALMRVDQEEKAVLYLEDAVKFWPGEAAFWSNLGAAYGRMGEHEEAVTALKQGLKLDPHSKQLRRNLRIAYRNLGRHEEADALKKPTLQKN
jgi:tetratricopeptide (TPR) repeat protein